jgi:hypothetical protein
VGEAVGLAQVNRRAASADFQTFVFRLRRVSPRRARYFLAARQESTQRNAPRLPGPSGCPRCERLAGPVAKLAGQNPAGVGQRDRTSPGEPSSLGGSEGMKTVVLPASSGSGLLSTTLSLETILMPINPLARYRAHRKSCIG